jgi:hypothetical protein
MTTGERPKGGIWANSLATPTSWDDPAQGPKGGRSPKRSGAEGKGSQGSKNAIFWPFFGGSKKAIFLPFFGGAKNG